MSLTRKIAYNTGIQIFGRAITMLLGLITVAIMTRYFGPEGFGQYTTVIAFLQFFGIVVDFGLAVIIIQLISSRPTETEKLTSNIFTFRLVTALFFFILAPLVVWFFPYPPIIKWGVVVTSGALFCTSLNQVVISLFQRELQMYKVAIAEVVGRVTILLITILVVYSGWGLLSLLAGVVLGNLVGFILVFVFSRSITYIRLAFDWPVWREVFVKSWPIGLSIIFNLVYFRADIVILSLYRSQTEVGIYGVTYKVLEILAGIPYILMGLILPLLSAAWAQKDGSRFQSIMQRTWDLMALITIPLVFGGIILAKPIMNLVAGSGFSSSDSVLRILLLATGAIYLSTIFNHAIIALEEQKKMLKGFFLVAVVSLVGYFSFIPLYSYWAAAWITVVAEILILIISAAIVWRKLKRFISFRVFNLSLLGGALMSLVIYLFISVGLANLFLLVVLGALVYFLFTYLLGAIDRKSLREILGKNKN